VKNLIRALLATLRDLRPHLLAGVVAVAAAILMTWPLAAEAGSGVLRAIYFWDAYCNTMILGSRVDAALGLGPLSLYDAYYFAPLPDAIVFNENHFGLSLLFAPFYLLGGPIWGYNATLLLSLALSVFFTHLLVRRLTGSSAAGIVSGVAFAFCPYVAFELGRIQLVATQWIPACFLFLHRAIEGGKRRDAFAFWACYVLQVGTCLYYAMFLVPLLALLGGLLLSRKRPQGRFYAWFGTGAVGAAALALSMVRPYFAARSSFDLARSLDFASHYDGKLAFFTNVHELNRTWTGLHQPTLRPGAPEEIAFPGLLVLVLATLALGSPFARAWKRSGAGRLAQGLAFWLILAAGAALLTLVTRSFLSGALLLALGAWFLAARRVLRPFSGDQGAYLALFILGVALFVGLEPLKWQGAPVRGLYYYLYTYVPGFDGIRKVSRQAIMTSFLLAVLAGFGSAVLLRAVRGRRGRRWLTGLLLGATVLELRCFPHPIQPVFAAEKAPKVLEFVRSLPSSDLAATLPQTDGRKVMRGDAGMALHDYLALYHKHRFVNGQSSYEPPVTTLARRALDALPEDAARRALLAIGTRHLIVYGDELPSRRGDLVLDLLARETEYELALRDGPDSVVSLVGPDAAEFSLLETPRLAASVQLVPQDDLRVRSSHNTRAAGLAIDGREDTHWSSGRPQQRGQFFEIQLRTPRAIRALEIVAPGRVMDVPASFRLTASRGPEDLGVLLERPQLRLYREQVFSPKTFVWRVVLAEPVLATRLRITLGQGVPGHYFSIHELSVYAE
jgi:hypothetical protein